jgi:hypothetical protein
VSPLPEVAPTAIEWKYTKFGFQGALRSATVRNRGSAPFTVARESLGGPQASDFDRKESCEGRTLGPGETCEVSFYFHPTTPLATGDYHATFKLVTDVGVVLGVDLHGTSDKAPG